MKYYGIADPYEKSNKYYKDHYVCLWEVTKTEIVGHWQWDDLIAHENWYEEIVLPAFRQEDRKAVETNSLSNLFAKFSCKPVVWFKISQANYEVKVTDHSDPTSFYGCSESPSEEQTCDLYDDYDDSYDAYGYFQDENDTDTDDEVEKANAGDDMIKAME